ncbi:MAG: hypothetical protein GXP13_06900 [Gammaproteobacteria bacterium]|nr:hypothetical protein [Gammaproteobacteria bacterium]
MNKVTQGFFMLSALLLTLPVFAGGHLRVINDTSNSIDVECGHDASSGKAYGISHEHAKSIKVHGEGDVRCHAFNSRGRKIASRTFYYGHDGNDSYRWRVSSHRNNSGH